MSRQQCGTAHSARARFPDPCAGCLRSGCSQRVRPWASRCSGGSPVRDLRHLCRLREKRSRHPHQEALPEVYPYQRLRRSAPQPRSRRKPRRTISRLPPLRVQERSAMVFKHDWLRRKAGCKDRGAVTIRFSSCSRRTIRMSYSDTSATSGSSLIPRTYMCTVPAFRKGHTQRCFTEAFRLGRRRRKG